MLPTTPLPCLLFLCYTVVSFGSLATGIAELLALFLVLNDCGTVYISIMTAVDGQSQDAWYITLHSVEQL